MAKPTTPAGIDDYLHMFGLCALATCGSTMAAAAPSEPEAGANGGDGEHERKLVTAASSWSACCRRPAAQLSRIQAGAASTMELPDEMF